VPRSKKEWSYTFTPPLRLHGVVLSFKKHRDNLTFTFTSFHIITAQAQLKRISFKLYSTRTMQMFPPDSENTATKRIDLVSSQRPGVLSSVSQGEY
jgi:hypothetical protein